VVATNQIVGEAKILAFLLAGNCLFTLRSRKTGEHFTYRVKKEKAQGTKNYYVLAGHGGYLGTLRLDSNRVLRFFPGIKPEPQNVFAHKLPFAWFINHTSSDQIELWHTGRCGKCNRRLTDPTSIERGLGPECAQTFTKRKVFKRLHDDDNEHEDQLGDF